MVRGIETAAAGMMGILDMNDVIANNLANVNSAGFKNSILAFKNIKDLAVNQINQSTQNPSDSSQPLGKLSTGSAVDSTILDLRQGGIKTTGNPLDLAINGKGFFEVKTPNGPAYTRNGSFISNQNGTVTTQEGYQLMGEKGPIVINKNDSLKNLQIGIDGTVTVNQKSIDKIKVVNFNKPEYMESLSGSLYKPAQNDTPKEEKNFQLTQGALESSNVNVIECMVNSIKGSRTYEAMAKTIETSSKTENKAATELGRVKR